MAKSATMLTQKQIDLIHEKAEQKLPLRTVANQLGMDRKTLINALARQGYGEWMQEAFPSRKGYGSGGGKSIQQIRSQDQGEMRKLKPEQIKAPLNIDMSSLYVKSAVMPWRHAG